MYIVSSHSSMTRENKGAQWKVHEENNTYQHGSGWRNRDHFWGTKLSAILHHNFALGSFRNFSPKSMSFSKFDFIHHRKKQICTDPRLQTQRRALSIEHVGQSSLLTDLSLWSPLVGFMPVSTTRGRWFPSAFWDLSTFAPIPGREKGGNGWEERKGGEAEGWEISWKKKIVQVITLQAPRGVPLTPRSRSECSYISGV